MSNSAFENLAPSHVWKYFHEITQVPRPSKKETQILQYLKNFCTLHGLNYKEDKVNNIVITKAATQGMENVPTVILQSHVDMVCEKNKETVHNFDKDPIPAYIDGDWVKAEGTTLGADNGLGVASMLAILASHDIEHGPLECLFTVDEETGLTGANGLDPNLLTGKLLLNLDTEDEGVFTIGCAGGMDTLFTLTPQFEKSPANLIALNLEVKGLHGGHSGVDINKGRENALKLLARVLSESQDKFKLLVSDFSGGNLRNAIPREAQATLLIAETELAPFSAFISEMEAKLKEKYSKNEEGLKISVSRQENYPTQAYTADFQRKFIKALQDCPHGVLKMSSQISTLVETSTNLAAVKTEANKIIISTSQRSSIEKDKATSSESVIAAFSALKPEITSQNKYPGWAPNFSSPLLELFKNTYLKLYKKEPVIEVIHAGLECGILGEKKPDMDMISFGPTILGAHSPTERAQISTVEKYWALLLQVLKDIPRA